MFSKSKYNFKLYVKMLCCQNFIDCWRWYCLVILWEKSTRTNVLSFSKGEYIVKWPNKVCAGKLWKKE